MKSKIYTIPELNNPSSENGNGEKGLLIILDNEDKNQNIKTLEGLVKAIKLDIQNDVKIITIESQPLDLNNIINQQPYNTVILIGLNPNQVGFNINAGKYFFYHLEKFSILITDSLSDLNSDKSKKMKFWQNLQERYLQNPS